MGIDDFWVVQKLEVLWSLSTVMWRKHGVPLNPLKPLNPLNPFDPLNPLRTYPRVLPLSTDKCQCLLHGKSRKWLYMISPLCILECEHNLIRKSTGLISTIY